MLKLTFKQQVLTGFAVSLLFVLISAITSYKSVEKIDDDSRWQAHTYEVITNLKNLEAEVLNAETGLRGFMLAEEGEYLKPYIKYAPRILPTIQDLKQLVRDNPVQSKRADSMDVYGNRKVSEMQQIMRTHDTQGAEAAIKRILTGKGQLYREQMMMVGKKMIDEEQRLLAGRKVNLVKSSRNSVVIILSSAFVIFCLILFLFTYIQKTFDQQKLTEEQIRRSNLELEKISTDNEQKNWLLSGASAVNESMRGEQEIEELSASITTTISKYIEAPVGAFFLINKSGKTFKFTGGYAYQQPKGEKNQYRIGEGLIGQVAIEKKATLLSNIPEDHIKITSGLGQSIPKYLYLVPVIFENETLAVMELGLQEAPDEKITFFLNSIVESIGVAVNSAVARVRLRALFEQTQQQAEELASQQEELRTTNEELMFKTDQLQSSEEELRVQQEELRQTNAELEEKAQQLEERNIAINQAREAISLKAEELEISSKYKSEFLANMSHELRTPLNSILILARILKENRPENLNEDQIKYAGVIHNAGNDLLNLINDILDLSKIESGKVDLSIEAVKPESIRNSMESLFTELAKSKKIQFNLSLAEDLPAQLFTDQSRMEQIVKNLLSNAFKFTPEHGKIDLSFDNASKNKIFYADRLRKTTEAIVAISVKDSGIGIPKDKQKLIFEAFQQADGSTSRKFGGTGLGLSISKELAYILGGEIQVESTPNEGSTFTLFVPVKNIFENQEQTTEVAVTAVAEDVSLFAEPEIQPVSSTDEQQTLLIIEDDVIFAEVLSDYAIEKGFKPILAYSGDTGLEMAFTKHPDAIVLDVMLPVIDGWTILKKLKADPGTKHIPVHMMSAGNEKAGKAKQEGAIGFLKKPVEKEQLDEAFELLSDAYLKYNFRRVLVIEDQELQSRELTKQLEEKGVDVAQAFTGKEAMELLEEQEFDCIILDLKLPDISGFDLLDNIKAQPALTHIPVIINTAMELDQDKMAHIMRYTDAMVLKSNKSNDRLIDEVSLFINKLKQEGHTVPAKSGNKTKGVSTMEKVLKDKTILITDDDMRNIFALSSALQVYDLKIVIANNGREALEKLDESPQIDLVLMDIMMPEMDGYEAMKAIRLEKRFARLPIIALTAKAMKNDREKCIEAGANDYISKPVDMDKLLSMLRVWLS